MVWRRRRFQEILSETRAFWDAEDTPAHVRREFARVLKCRTGELGYSWRKLPNGKFVRRANSCKSRVCPSCGWKATLDWVNGIKAALPDGEYAGIGFTMPDVLWDAFWQNRALLKDLPNIGAGVIASWAHKQFGCELPILVVRHTFGAHLNFNCHLHILVPKIGLHKIESTLVEGVYFPKRILVRAWRDAVLDYLDAAVKGGVQVQSAHVYDMAYYLETQEDALWNGNVDPYSKRTLFAKYISRYLRRPPISERRLMPSDDRHIRYLSYDKKLKKEMVDQVLKEDFVNLLIQQVLDPFEHAPRYFGLLSPRRSREFDLYWTLLGQTRPPRPARLTYAQCLAKILEKDRRIR